MDSDFDYLMKKKSKRVYTSKAFNDVYSSKTNENPRKLRFVSQVYEKDPFMEYCYENGSIVIRVTPKEKEEIKALVVQDERRITQLILQRFNIKNGKPTRNSFNLGPDEIEDFITMVLYIYLGDFSDPEKKRFDVKNSSLTEILNKDLLLTIIQKDPNLLQLIAKSSLTSSDIKAINYRKEQLNLFSSKLSDSSLVERDWQEFFENNKWIFGYGLSYISTTNLNSKKLEQIVSGFDIQQVGKRVDALIKSRGLISSLSLVEIKTPNTPLLNKSTYRSGTYQPSSELTGGIAQSHQTAHALMKKLMGPLEIKGEGGFSTGETVYSYLPKSYLVIGNLNQFIKDSDNISDDMYRSFEIFRKNLTNPEIITYDELYERAKFIVENDEKEQMMIDEEIESNFSEIMDELEENKFDDEDLPF